MSSTSGSSCDFGKGYHVYPLHENTIVVLYDHGQTLAPILSFHIYSTSENAVVKVRKVGCEQCKNVEAVPPLSKYPCLYTYRPTVNISDIGLCQYNVTVQHINSSAYGLVNLTVQGKESHIECDRF